jgi:hypothetical protein
MSLAVGEVDAQRGIEPRHAARESKVMERRTPLVARAESAYCATVLATSLCVSRICVLTALLGRPERAHWQRRAT